MAVTVAPDVERRLGHRVVLLIRSGDPPERVAAAVHAAVPDIYGTGVIVATREEVIAGEVTRHDGTRWRPTELEWANDHVLAGIERPSYVATPVAIPGGQLLVIDYSSTPQRMSRLTPAILMVHLHAAGVQDAQISLAPELSEQRYGILGSFTPVARGGMRPRWAAIPPGGSCGYRSPPGSSTLRRDGCGASMTPGWSCWTSSSRPGCRSPGTTCARW